MAEEARRRAAEWCGKNLQSWSEWTIDELVAFVADAVAQTVGEREERSRRMILQIFDSAALSKQAEEIARLTAALEKIDEADDHPKYMRAIARTALEGRDGR